jgi:hypothetical protein
MLQRHRMVRSFSYRSISIFSGNITICRPAKGRIRQVLAGIVQSVSMYFLQVTYIKVMAI